MPNLNEMIGSIARSALNTLSRPAQTRGELALPGLQQPVEVQRDPWGVPHIFASSLPDLMVAQGFVHGQERLFQMEINRRTAAGRMSEILGEVALPLDRWVRTLTLQRVAEFEYGLLDENTRTLLQAYANGVTAAMQHGPQPVEFTLLRHRPEPWSVVDSLSWIKMMAWGLSVNWESELLRARLIERLGPEKAAELDPDYRADWPTVLPIRDFSGLGTRALAQAEAARPFSGPSPYAGVGSNNWVVHGQRTASGKPLLANDMHLMLSIPSIWYENHLHCPELQVTGVSFPGLPGVLAGHNGRVAWGFTNGFPDVQDLYMERTRRTADGGLEVEYNGAWEAGQVLRERIPVKGQQPVEHEVLVTRHGPVINSLAVELCGETPLALRWTALEPNTMIAGLLAMNQAQDVHSFHQALRHWHTPVQNIVYADIHGDIGYTLPGRIPIRRKGDGQVPVPGWTDAYEWERYIPFEDLPHTINPPEGYVASANNRVVGDAYPYYLGRETISADRALRIHELLAAEPVLDITSFERMHTDLVCPSARRLTAALDGLHSEEPHLQVLLERLRDWDGRLGADSVEAAVYEVFYRRLLYLLLSDRLDEFVLQKDPNAAGRLEATRSDLTERYLGKGPTPLLEESSIYGFRALEWLLALLEQPQSPWYDLGGGQDRQAVLLAALADTQRYLQARLGAEIENWRWGELHRLLLAHTLGSVEAIGVCTNRGPYPIGGDQNTVWATGTHLHRPEGQDIVGPPYRMIIDLGNLANSQSVLLPGQSGRPGTPHYDDQIEDWFNGRYHPMLFSEQQLAEVALEVLRLLPAGETAAMATAEGQAPRKTQSAD
jgi:penicillin amidase